ncbi:hypothetical protein GNP81_16390 [Aliivibrio fischeri]|uniref:hypothetical protein n=1 Tax=Aliivibrio fischeri TaxID=668 RepID=UPI0012D9A9CB|nr:hypothetical protein [Aliivibrio fischeri]MUK62714.1 hypothetical protein [Aliivibrio fischeri]MUL22386.1 hypothetical protein [Aliivibrio fischeri]MUL26177.1 hypothetical protein [Aliivibrio fischeri]
MSLNISKMKKIAGAANNVKIVQAAKSVVAINFYTDGNLFIERYDLMNSHHDLMQHRQFRAKAMVDLAMSLECSLKSLVISLSPSTQKPKAAIKKARDCSHDHQKLYRRVKVKAKHRVTLASMDNLILDDLAKFGVGSRYTHEIWNIQTSGKLSVNEELLYRTIDNPEWMTTLRNLAVQWNNEASRVHQKYLRPHTILSGKQLSRLDAELAKIK